jgi:hypothetical protein
MSPRTPVIALLSALVFASPLPAQDDAPPPAEPSVEEGAEPSPEAMAAAEDLMAVMDLGALTRATTESMLENMFAQNPGLEQFRDVFIDFFDEHLRWEHVRDDYLRLYAEVYTPQELRDLAGFYQTPLGRRLLETTPVVSARGALIGEAAIQPHLPELQRRLSEAAEASMGSPEQ